MLFLEHLMPSSLFLEKASCSSFLASRGRHELVPACTKKAPMINLTKGLSKAYAKDGILVNASPRCNGYLAHPFEK